MKDLHHTCADCGVSYPEAELDLTGDGYHCATCGQNASAARLLAERTERIRSHNKAARIMNVLGKRRYAIHCTDCGERLRVGPLFIELPPDVLRCAGCPATLPMTLDLRIRWMTEVVGKITLPAFLAATLIAWAVGLVSTDRLLYFLLLSTFVAGVTALLVGPLAAVTTRVYKRGQ